MSTLTANATANPTGICAGQTSQLNVTASGGSMTYTYSWTSIPIGFTSNSQNPVVSPLVTTKYIAHVNDGFIVVTDTVQVNVTAAPSVSAGSDTTYCSWADQIPLHGIATSYQSVMWSTSGTGTFANIGTPSTTYYPSSQDKTNGNVNLTLTAYAIAPCTNAVNSTRHILFDPCTGISENGNDPFSISLAPNPSGGLFVLTVKGGKNLNLSISVNDFEGKLVLQTSIRSTQNTLSKKMDLSHFAKGIYIVKVQTESQVITDKLIIK